MQLQTFTKYSEEEGSFGQGVRGNLRLPRRRHLALLALYAIKRKKNNQNSIGTQEIKSYINHIHFHAY